MGWIVFFINDENSVSYKTTAYKIVWLELHVMSGDPFSFFDFNTGNLHILRY